MERTRILKPSIASRRTDCTLQTEPGPTPSPVNQCPFSNTLWQQPMRHPTVARAFLRTHSQEDLLRTLPQREDSTVKHRCASHSAEGHLTKPTPFGRRREVLLRSEERR